MVLVNKPGTYEMSMPDDDQHTLKLQRVRGTDVGQLVVTASNQFGSDLCTLQLAMAGQFSPEHHMVNLAFQLESKELTTEFLAAVNAKEGKLFVI